MLTEGSLVHALDIFISLALKVKGPLVKQSKDWLFEIHFYISDLLRNVLTNYLLTFS